MAIGQLKQSPDDYSPYVPEAFDAYVSTMAKDGEWGDNVFACKNMSQQVKCEARNSCNEKLVTHRKFI